MKVCSNPKVIYPIHLESSHSAPHNTGFEPALASLLVERMGGANITWIPCPSAEDRFTVLQNGAADFTIAQITYLPERETLARFIRPFYYESGITLFTLPGLNTVDTSGGWESLRGKAVCTEIGTFAADFARDNLGLSVVPLLVNSSDVAREAEVLSKVRSGECIGSLCDSTQETCIGIKNSGLPAVSLEPYAVAIALDASAELEAALTAAMVDVMTGGSESAISKLETEWVTPNGVPGSANLPLVVEAVSTFSIPAFPFKGIPAANGETGSNATLPATLRVGVSGSDNWPMSRPANGSANGADFQGFEPALAQSLCAALNSTCKLVGLETLEDRFTALEEDRVDATISFITVTPERAARVQLLAPYYYSSGSVVFLPPDAETPKSWKDLKGKTLCVEKGDIAATLVLAEGLQVMNVTRLDAAEVGPLVANGSCIGVVSDSTLAGVLGNYVNSKLPPLGVAPYAVAIRKQRGDALGTAISAALVDMMAQGDGSEMLQLENDYVVPYGVPANGQLPYVVDAMTDFAINSDGAPVSAAAGGRGRAGAWTVVATAAAAVLIGL
jgi:glutamate transport system substrate-binding protein